MAGAYPGGYTEFQPASLPFPTRIVDPHHERVPILGLLEGGESKRRIAEGKQGSLAPGQKADLAVFPTDHYNEILYHRGRLKPVSVWKDGRCVLNLSNKAS